jgi:hypothetical protein
MISASDVLHVISEMHQFSMLLLELRDTTMIGISHDPSGKLNYFRYKGKLGRTERNKLTQEIYSGELPESVHLLSVEELIQEIEGKKARHIWLESAGTDRRELGFLSISELKTYFQKHPQR